MIAFELPYFHMVDQGWPKSHGLLASNNTCNRVQSQPPIMHDALDFMNAHIFIQGEVSDLIRQFLLTIKGLSFL